MFPLEPLLRLMWMCTSTVVPWATSAGAGFGVMLKFGEPPVPYVIERSSKASALPSSPGVCDS